jgi:hypothetical protein
MTQHLDDIWVRPLRVERSQGDRGFAPNIGDVFLVVYLHIRNQSGSVYRVSYGDFEVLDGHGQLDPPLQESFTRRRLREVQLIPGGQTDGTLVFEVPFSEPLAELIYQPDILNPSKQKLWLLK